jgi:hypothetical protein
MMTKSNKIWDELESDTSFTAGLLYKRFSAEVKPDILIALKAVERYRCLAIRLSLPLNIDPKEWNNLKDVKIELMPDEQHQGKAYLLILLLSREQTDIFSTLCEDLISFVSDIIDETILIEKLKDRLTKWQSLFEKAGRSGLSENAQRGLYGEIFYLRKFLGSTLDYLSCVKSWKGPEKSIQDFQHSDWAVEVKTTHGKNHQKIHISSERQLDTEIIPFIYLYHLSLDVRSGNGETLNELVDSMGTLLKGNVTAANTFKMKLLEAAYYEHHKYLYEDMGYTIRQENFYHVTGDFPRITERQIPKGVGDVKYSVVLTESESWRLKEADVLKRLAL